MTEYSITNLEKSVRVLGRKLEERGFDVDIDVFKSGTTYWGDTPPSYVKLRVDGEGVFLSRKFISGGYTTSGYSDISTANGMREAKQEFMTILERKINFNKQ